MEDSGLVGKVKEVEELIAYVREKDFYSRPIDVRGGNSLSCQVTIERDLLSGVMIGKVLFDLNQARHVASAPIEVGNEGKAIDELAEAAAKLISEELVFHMRESIARQNPLLFEKIMNNSDPGA